MGLMAWKNEQKKKKKKKSAGTGAEVPFPPPDAPAAIPMGKGFPQIWIVNAEVYREILSKNDFKYGVTYHCQQQYCPEEKKGWDG